MAGARYILCQGSWGDTICLTPALAALKREDPKRRLTVFYQTRQQRDVLQHNPAVDRLLPTVTGIARWLWPSIHWFRWRDVARTDYQRHRPNRGMRVPLIRLLGEMVGARLRDETPRLFLTDAERAVGLNYLQRTGDGRPVVAVQCDSESTPNNRWPAAHWGKLVAAHPDLAFVHVGPPGPDRLPGAIDARARPLRETFAILAQCRAFIGIDSSFAHAATALSVPAVVLFGPATVVVHGHAPNRNLATSATCSPCVDVLGAAECPFDRRCLASLSPGLVSANLRAILSGTQPCHPLTEAEPHAPAGQDLLRAIATRVARHRAELNSLNELIRQEMEKPIAQRAISRLLIVRREAELRTALLHEFETEILAPGGPPPSPR